MINSRVLSEYHVESLNRIISHHISDHSDGESERSITNKGIIANAISGMKSGTASRKPLFQQMIDISATELEL